MSNTGFKGVDVRQSGNQLVCRAFQLDAAGAVVTSGTTSLSYLELQSDGTVKTYDFTSNTFKTSGMTSSASVASMTHRTRLTDADAAVNLGIWTHALSTLSGFTTGGIYFAVVVNSSASPIQQVREFQYGSAEGNLVVGSTGAIESNPVQLGGNSQTLTDLKDFADAGYDPLTHKVQGVVLVDTTTTNTDMRGTDGAMLAYTQPAGFLAATFPSDPADHSLVISATNALLAAISALNNLSAGQVRTELAVELARIDAPVSSASAPTVEEIDAELSANHGDTAWGAATVQITPFTATVSGGEVSNSGKITAYQFTRFGPYTITVVDANGDPVDLSGCDLRFIGYTVELGDAEATKFFELASGDDEITIGGAGHNVLTVLGSTDPTQLACKGFWVVRDVTNNDVVARGELVIPAVPAGATA